MWFLLLLCTRSSNTEVIESKRMGDRRALLTDSERQILLGEKEVNKNHYHTVVSRVREKIKKLEEDKKALQEHGELMTELQDVVCSDTRDAEETQDNMMGEPPDMDSIDPETIDKLDQLDTLLNDPAIKELLRDRLEE